jgi:hypothetical protein
VSSTEQPPIEWAAGRPARRRVDSETGEHVFELKVRGTVDEWRELKRWSP